MAFSDFKDKECLCAFVATLGDFSQVLYGLIDNVTSLLGVMRSFLLIIPSSSVEELEKKLLELELFAIQTALNTIEAPLMIITAYAKPYADCPPVANLSKTIIDFKDEVLSSIYDFQFEVQQKVDSIKEGGYTIATFESWLTLLTDAKEALDQCKEQ